MTSRPAFLRLIAGAALLCTPLRSSGQALPLPPRPPGAPAGRALVSALAPLSRETREEEVFRQIMAGNVPPFLRTLVPVTDTALVQGTVMSVTYLVTPDYMALGSDDDYLLMPMTPLLAQRVADALGCSLPTRKMVDAIYRAAALRLRPEPIPPRPAMVTVPVFGQHQALINSQRGIVLGPYPLGALVAGHKKDVIISNDVYTHLRPGVPAPVVIYGWHTLDGVPIQRAYNGHGNTYADYSHGIRLVHETVRVDGAPRLIGMVLADPGMCDLLSDEGVLPRARYPAAPAGRRP